MRFHACARSVVFLAVGLVVGLAGVARGAEHTKDTLETVQENLANGKAILVDIREQREWDEGHLQQARLFPLSEMRQVETEAELLEKLTRTLPKDQIIYCHCGRGVRVLTAHGILEKLGYDVRPLAQGFRDLKEAGFAEAEK